MKLALEDQIWKRIYGPYGNKSVNTLRAQLSDQWDTAIAEKLFGEELHHQNDIYPARLLQLCLGSQTFLRRKVRVLKELDYFFRT